MILLELVRKITEEASWKSPQLWTRVGGERKKMPCLFELGSKKARMLHSNGDMETAA